MSQIVNKCNQNTVTIHVNEENNMFLVLLALGCVDYELTVVRWWIPMFNRLEKPVWISCGSSTTQRQCLKSKNSWVRTQLYFYRLFDSGSVDFQLGVITTDIDVDSPGMLVDNTMLTRDSSQIASRFANLISLDEGSRDEYGFETTLAALDPSGINGDVLNANADLEIVFFSDEDEQSDISVDAFVNTLANL